MVKKGSMPLCIVSKTFKVGACYSGCLYKNKTKYESKGNRWYDMPLVFQQESTSLLVRAAL